MKNISSFVIALVLAGFLLLALTDKGFSEVGMIPPCPCDTEELSNGLTGDEIVQIACPNGSISNDTMTEIDANLVLIITSPLNRLYFTQQLNESTFICEINADNVSPVTLFINDEAYELCRERLVAGCGLLADINLKPLEETNPILTEHTVTATVEANGEPVPNVLVSFEVISGPNSGEISDPNSGECTPDDCTTDANGEVSWTYSSEQLGTDTIVASFFDEGIESTVESNNVEKIWVPTPRNIPTMSEWGLIAMSAVLGIIGLLAIRRRKVTT